MFRQSIPSKNGQLFEHQILLNIGLNKKTQDWEVEKKTLWKMSIR